MIATTASAPAKIILLGEHAVVYDQPAIAVPVASLRATVSVRSSDGPGLRVVAGDIQRDVPVAVEAAVDDALAHLIQLVLRRLGHPEPPPLTLEIASDIPVASGLGSGAAVAAAVARALTAALGQPLPDDDLNALVYESEKQFHGTPSGIDNTVVVYEQPVYFRRGHPIESVAIGQPFEIVIADTGQSALTRDAIAAVRALYDADADSVEHIFADIGALVERARTAIEAGDAAVLGSLMTRNHDLLRLLTVSSPALDQLVTAALNVGALGAKLSGGGRGGNMIALVTADRREAVMAALRAAGAARVVTTTVSASSPPR